MEQTNHQPRCCAIFRYQLLTKHQRWRSVAGDLRLICVVVYQQLDLPSSWLSLAYSPLVYSPNSVGYRWLLTIMNHQLTIWTIKQSVSTIINLSIVHQPMLLFFTTINTKHCRTQGIGWTGTSEERTWSWEGVLTFHETCGASLSGCVLAPGLIGVAMGHSC